MIDTNLKWKEKIVNEKQYVIFRLGKEEYSVDIEKVDEISELLKITKIPNEIYFLEGIVRLRGEIIPIINLKILLLVQKS